jgi:hypothetical protein
MMADHLAVMMRLSTTKIRTRLCVAAVGLLLLLPISNRAASSATTATSRTRPDMGITNLYGPQAFTAGSLSFGHSPAYRSSNSLVSTWTDAPISGYPEVWLMEDVLTVPGAGPNGEIAIRAQAASSSWASGIGFGGMGALTRGQWDMNPAIAGNFTVEWDQEFRTDYWDVSDYAQLIFIGQDFDHNQDAAVDFGSDFVFIELNQTTGYGFTWGVKRAFEDTGSGFSSVETNEAASFSVDNTWRTLKLVVIPSTVTGAFAGNGTIGSGSLAADGSITLYSKLSTDPSSAYVQEFSLTGLKFAVNGYETTSGHTTYARGITFGEATFVGGITNIHAYFDAPVVQIKGSFVFGADGTLTSTRTILANLDGTTRTVNRPGTFYIGGDLVVTGDVIYTGASSQPTSFYNSLVTTADGDLVIDSDGNVVFVEGSDS